ncbi:hypothetical protein RDI58_013341 [Solanum bulbocastanum]|uniref:Uncharacterized protein n=1 Tax=Solanum bulbocastanum TaxID=147425 RepID=A0AAN8TQ14_SOLBU
MDATILLSNSLRSWKDGSHSAKIQSKTLLLKYKTPHLPDSSKQWREIQIQKITDKVFDSVRIDSGRENLKLEDLYIDVLLVFNDINKRLSGHHFDPPTKLQVRALMQGLLITLAVAPTITVLTKRSTEGVLHIGKVVQKMSNSVYASLLPVPCHPMPQSTTMLKDGAKQL